eukprot:1076038-Rhodomonas_salina.1
MELRAKESVELTRPILERLLFKPRKSEEEPEYRTPQIVTGSADGKQPKKKAQLNPECRRRLKEAAESCQQAPGKASADANAAEQDARMHTCWCCAASCAAYTRRSTALFTAFLTPPTCMRVASHTCNSSLQLPTYRPLSLPLPLPFSLSLPLSLPPSPPPAKGRLRSTGSGKPQSQIVGQCV